MPTFDVHQHLWPEPFIAALARRARPPRLRGSTLELAGEGAFEMDLGEHELDRRLALLDREEVDVAVVSLQPTLEIELLPEDEAAELVDAYHAGMRELVAGGNGRVRALGASACPDGFVGASVAGRELVDEPERLDSLLADLESRGAFLFVHPGPARRPGALPGWWAAVVDYTAEMQAAYAAWLARGVHLYPDLRVLFAILAGGAPFQLERLRTRGVKVRSTLHPNVYLDTASYGRRALELCLSTYGVGQLVYGTDTPVIDAAPTREAVASFGEAVFDAVCRENPRALLA